MMWPDSSDKQLRSGASELFSPGEVPHENPYGKLRLVVNSTGVLGDVEYKDLRSLEGG